MNQLSIKTPAYPSLLIERLGSSAPSLICSEGNLDLLALPKTALFCSSRCPGRAILAAYDQAAYWREQGRCVISGFHSAVEEECLRILLRGKQPIVICLARSMYSTIPLEWQKPLAENRLLILSAFPAEKRVTADLALRRNELVAALAEEIYFVHIVAQGHTARLAQRVAEWGMRSVSCDHR